MMCIVQAAKKLLLLTYSVLTLGGAKKPSVFNCLAGTCLQLNTIDLFRLHQ